MATTRELTITYAGVTFGGSTARQITEYSIHEEEYEQGYFEFEFVTSATTDAAFATELSTVGTALRTPRQNLLVTQNASTLLSRSHSANTGLDTAPTILKEGDPADTGRSRHFRVRIAYGLPADTVNTDFRRYATVTVNYGPQRVRTVTIAGTYTANSSGGTGSFAQYLASISAYATATLSGIDASATWEKIDEPQVERNDTDKVTNFAVIYKEIIYPQSASGLNDPGIVDPQLVFSVQRIAPGDSPSISVGVSNTGSVQTAPGAGSGSGGTVTTIGTNTPIGGGGGIARPSVLTVSYTAGIDSDVTTDLAGKYSSSIRPFIIGKASIYNGGAVILVDEKVDYGDVYNNRLSAVLIFHTYTAPILSQTVNVNDSTNYGKVLRPVWDGNPYSMYEYTGSATRLKTVTEDREEVTGIQDANAYVERLVAISAAPVGLSSDWVVISRAPGADVKMRGLPGADTAFVATAQVVTVFQFRKKKNPSVANAGGLFGGLSGGAVAT